MPEKLIQADPQLWAYSDNFRSVDTAPIIIDMETDFYRIGGYVNQMSYDLSRTRAPIGPIKLILVVMCKLKGYFIIHAKVAYLDQLQARLILSKDAHGCSPILRSMTDKIRNLMGGSIFVKVFKFTDSIKKVA